MNTFQYPSTLQLYIIQKQSYFLFWYCFFCQILFEGKKSKCTLIQLWLVSCNISIINFSCQLHGRVITCSGKELNSMQTVQMLCFGKQLCYGTNSKFCVSKSFKAINKPYIQIKNVKNKFSYNEAYDHSKFVMSLRLTIKYIFVCSSNVITPFVVSSTTWLGIFWYQGYSVKK